MLSFPSINYYMVYTHPFIRNSFGNFQDWRIESFGSAPPITSSISPSVRHKTSHNSHTTRFLRRGAFYKRQCPSVHLSTVFPAVLLSVGHFLYGKTLPLFLSDIFLLSATKCRIFLDIFCKTEMS